MFKRIAAALAVTITAVAGPVAANTAAAGKYPDHLIMLVSPYQAGGSTETFARLLIEDMGVILGQTIVIEQRPGASGTIGARRVALAKPDGYTLLANTSQHVMYDGMFSKLPFDPMKDFVPVGLLGSSPIIVAVAESSKFKTFRDVLQAAQTQEITFASGAQGSLPHLTGERVAVMGQLKMKHVAFSGAAPAVTNVMGGHVELLYATAASVMSQIRGGKLRALAVSTKERLSELPDVPTIAESGMPDFDVTAWYGVWAPKGTSSTVVKTINDAMRAASSKPAVRKRMQEFSITPSELTAERFAAFCERERETWMGVMKSINMVPQN